MQAPPRNPDSRPLPNGWAEHFDSQRRLWYYIDLDAPSPRVTFVHPCDVDVGPASAPAPTASATGRRDQNRPTVRPTGSRDIGSPLSGPSTAANGGGRDPHRTRRATVAQQLYASSLTQASSRNVLPVDPASSRASSRRPSVSGSSIHTIDEGSTTTPNNLTPRLKSHDPRNFFDTTRLSRGTRRMTYTGPHPQPPPPGGAYTSSSSSTATAAPAASSSIRNINLDSDSIRASKKPTPSINGSLRSTALEEEPTDPRAFYHPSVVSSNSPPTGAQTPTQASSASASAPAPANGGSSSSHDPRYNPRRSSALPLLTGGTSHQKLASHHMSMLPPRKHSVSSSYTAMTEDNAMLMPPSTTAGPFAYASSRSYKSSGTTEDNLMVMPPSRNTSMRSKRSSMQAPAPIDVSSLHDFDAASTYSYNSIPRTQTTKAMRRNTVASPLAPQQPILQPKPVKPLNGVSLNLQVQVADSDEDTERHESAKRSAKDKVKAERRKGFTLGGLSIFGVRSRDKDVDNLSSRMDESFLMVDS